MLDGRTARKLAWAVGIPRHLKVYPADVRLIWPVAHNAPLELPHWLAPELVRRAISAQAGSAGTYPIAEAVGSNEPPTRSDLPLLPPRPMLKRRRTSGTSRRPTSLRPPAQNKVGAAPAPPAALARAYQPAPTCNFRKAGLTQ